MTMPRQVLPGADLMLTRRCAERRFLLRPDAETNNAFLYCLGLALERTGLQLTFVTAMTNHIHVGLHDPDGKHPEFSRQFHGLFARCMNAHRGHFEGFWSIEGTSAVTLVEPNDVLAKMVYAYTNPVAADLVEKVEDWPGVSSFEAAMNKRKLTATRPKFFFREESDLPKGVTILIHRPRGFSQLSHPEWRKMVTESVRKAEQNHRDRRRREGKSVLGRRRVLAQRPFDTPKTSAEHFGLKPRVAAKSKWARIEALQRLKAFLVKHRDAFIAWSKGAADVLFPHGTYRMRIFARVRCEPPDSEPYEVPVGLLLPAPT
jgi:REP element-mobilizing transposase RayT